MDFNDMDEAREHVVTLNETITAQRKRIAELEGALADTVKCMRLWADEEDGMPEAFYRQYVVACQLIDSRYCRVIRSGIQSCGDCMALSCGDNTNAEAKAALDAAMKGGAS